MTTLRRPDKQCSHPGCRENATRLGLCPQHHAEHKQRRLTHLHASLSQAERRQRYGAAWQRQRARILNRDGHACVYCGTDQRLEVHHLINTSTPTDAQLVTLCYRHHRAIEAEGKRGKVGKVGAAISQWIDTTGGNR